MNVAEFYSLIHGDYAGTMERLMKEERITKYLGKFLNNTDYDVMKKALEEKDWELAFRSSHNLKGMALNLGLGDVARSSSDLCEMLRGGEPKQPIDDQLRLVESDYAFTLEKIRELLGL